MHIRPRVSVDNLQVVHQAVLARAPEIVRILMAHGADARDGVYPHREATGAHAIASARGYDEITRIIEDEEQRRRDAASGVEAAPASDGRPTIHDGLRSSNSRSTSAIIC